MFPYVWLELTSHIESGLPTFAHPQFGRSIHVDMKAIPLLAEALKANPEGLRDCVSLCLESPDDSDCDEGFERKDLFEAKCQALVTVLDNLAQRGKLREFRWYWKQGWSDCGNARISPDVWNALARHGNTLQVMNVEHTSWEGSYPYRDSWVCFYRDFCLPHMLKAP